MTGYYVVLTGSKNNAGDFLIKHRAERLFSSLRPDREVVDIDAWKPFDSAVLELVNGAKALILLGGPALQAEMYPNVYALTANLNDIKVPITMMGIGWYSKRGDWRDTYEYQLSNQTVALLNKINESGLPISVRDYHSLNVLSKFNISRVLMTGCPAYFDEDFLGAPVLTGSAPSRVAFSMGVSFVKSYSMEQAMKSQILQLRDYFENSKFDVVFHHSLDPEIYLSIYKNGGFQLRRHHSFAKWLDEEGIGYTDISGSAGRLIDYYSGVDFHVGYRVHGHIFMSSVSRPSVLIAEDGRGRAVKDVIGGLVLEGVKRYNGDVFSRLFHYLVPQFGLYSANLNVACDIITALDHESRTNYLRLHTPRNLIDKHFATMSLFLSQLP